LKTQIQSKFLPFLFKKKEQRLKKKGEMIILSSLVLKMMNWTALAGGKGLLKLNSA